MAIFVVLLLLIPSLSFGQSLYLSPYTGNGSDATPFKAHGVDQGAQCKSLRANETLQAGYAICDGPSVPAQPGVIDLTGKRPIVKADRDKILAERGILVTATTFNGLISELVDTQNVSLGRKDGRQRIVVKGQEIWSRPAPLASYLPDVWHAVKGMFAATVAHAATTLSENFNAADDSTSPFSGQMDWTSTGGLFHGIVSNKYEVTNSVGVHETYASGTLNNSDMEVTGVLVATRGTATNIGAAVTGRHDGTGTPTFVYCMGRDAAATFAEFGHKVSGALTVDGTVNATVVSGSILKLRVVNDQLSCAIDGVVVLGPITENTGAGNVRIGTRSQGSGTATTAVVTLDDIFATNNVSAKRRGTVFFQ